MQLITFPRPDFDAPLTSLIFDLEHLRHREIKGTTPPWLFFGLKDIVRYLESLTSARIEGNRTTLLAVAERIIQGNEASKDESWVELYNIQQAIAFIERTVSDNPIDQAFISELHRLVVKDLVREGSKNPGKYRSEDVKPTKTQLQPPSHLQVAELMVELIHFIGQDTLPQDDLLRVAVVHHRMAAIHPFDNGNGRTTRLVTYAMLTCLGFIDAEGFRLLNPSAIFCMDREAYYTKLEHADTGDRIALLDWCEYLLRGIKEEITKIDKLLNRAFAVANIIQPALDLALEKKQINETEYRILQIAAKQDATFQAADILHLFGETPSGRASASRYLARMREQGFIMAQPKHPRRYVLRFSNNVLLRGVLQQLDVHKLLPIKLGE